MTIKQTSLFDTDLKELKEEDEAPSEMPINQRTEDFAPLAHRIRPEKFSEFIGHSEIFQKYPYLKEQNFPSVILY